MNDMHPYASLMLDRVTLSVAPFSAQIGVSLGLYLPKQLEPFLGARIGTEKAFLGAPFTPSMPLTSTHAENILLPISLTLAQSFFYRSYRGTVSNYVTVSGDVGDDDTYK